ncbi:MAG: glycosyltransferase [Lachnospiraceae bacterium]|nr:glycosyltransferase [Lachnospiraceae bacterium]
MVPFFSILIPVYNVEQYLEQCLDSLLNQTLENIQIICINDGSRDSCSSILSKYSHRDSRITVLNQKNSGYGFSLNRGLQHVQANYISIVEPDDFLAANAYELFYKDTQDFPQADIIKYAYWNFYENDTSKKTEPSNSSFLTLPEKTFKISQYPQLLLYHPSIWSCVYKTNFIKENRISFVEAPGAAWTDNPFFIASMCLAHNILWRNQMVYYYRQGHTTASSNLVDCQIPIRRLIEIFDFLEKYNIDDFGILLCIYKRVFHYINIVQNHNNYRREEMEPLIRQVLGQLDSNIVYTELFSTQEQNILQNFFNEKGCPL